MTEIAALPPGVVMILAALTILVLPRRLWSVPLVGAPLLTLAYVWYLSWLAGGECPPGPFAGCEGVYSRASYLGFDLYPVRVDPLGRIFATVFCFAAAMGGLFALSQSNAREMVAALAYAGAAVGAVLAGDVITLFIFWELMAIASTLVIWAGGTGAGGAGMRYAILHFLGGVLLMAGVAGHVGATGSTVFEGIGTTGIAGWLILAAFLINAGAPPFSAWVSDAYPVSSWSGMVYLSAFTTKTAVYTLIRGFPGEEMLIWIGLFMIFYGIIYAILENDIRRILAYSIVNQVGYMVVAVGIGTQLALNGAAAHAFAHILYKALLLMSAGAVLYQTGKHKCTDLGGLFRTMPLTCGAAIVGALAISAFPATAGFVAKSMITSAAGKEYLETVWIALMVASAAAFLYVGLKFPWFVFFGRDSGLRPADPPVTMRAAMGITAFFCVGLGIGWQPLYAMLPYQPAAYMPYDVPHVLLQLQLLFFAGLGFFLMLGALRPRETVTLDIDWFWRRGGRIMVREIAATWARTYAVLARNAMAALERMVDRLYRAHGPESALARTRPSGYMALWMTLLLGVFMAVSFL